MYKRLFIYIGVVASVLFTSCSKSEPVGKSVDMTFCASIDASLTRGDTAPLPNVDVCVMEIYYEGNLFDRQKSPLSATKQVVFTASMIAERTYDIVFWAEKDGSYNDASLKAITYSTPIAAPEDIDAFAERCLNQHISASTPAITAVTLKRPLSQIAITSTNPTPVSKVNAPAKYNLLTDTVSDYTDFTYNTSTFYMFIPSTPQQISLTIDDLSCTSVPAARNYKTNIIIH